MHSNMEKNILKNGYMLVNGINSSPKNTYKINLERTNITRIRQVNGVIKRKSQHSSHRKIIPSFYGFLTIFVVTLLVILVNKIPTGPRTYPDLQYQARLKANYFKPIANLSQFVLETELLIKPRLDELENTRLVVIVSSSVQHFDQRQAIRDTWSKLINFHQQKLFFIIGKPTPHRNMITSLDNSSIANSSLHMFDDANKLTYPIFDHDHDHQNNPSDPMMSKLNEQIVQEDMSFNDLIQYDFYDSYYNLTLKSLLILRYFNQEILNLTKSPSPLPSFHASLSYGSSSFSSSSLLSPLVTPQMPDRPYGGLKSPPIVPNGLNLKIKKPIFLLKVDDDMFVQVNNLIKLIDKLMVAFKVRKIPWNHRQEGYKILLGGLIKKAQPIRDPKSKYFVPFSVYPYNVYPNYLSGTGYLMSADVARSLFITTTIANKCRYFFLEDLYITGFCATKAVKMYDDYRYHEDQLMDIQLMHNFGFRFREIGSSFDICGYLSPYVITVHGLSPKQVRYLWSRINQPAKTAAYCNDRNKQRKRKG